MAEPIQAHVTKCSAPQMLFTTDTAEEVEETPTSMHIIAYGKSLCKITGNNLVQKGLILLLAAYFVSDTHPPCSSVTLKFVESYFLGKVEKESAKISQNICYKGRPR